MALSFWRNEFQVNTSVSGNQTSPVLVRLNGDHFAVVFGGRPGGALGGGAGGRIFNADGTPVDDDFFLRGASEALPDAAPLPTGGFVAVYEQPAGAIVETGTNASGFAIRARLFDSTGQPVPTQPNSGFGFQVNTTAEGDQRDPDVAVLSNGRFVVIWEDGQAVRGQIFNADGTPFGGEILITNGPANDGNPSVVALSTGGFFVVWNDGLPGAATISGCVFDSAGAPVLVNGGTNIFQVSSQTYTGAAQPALSILSDGRFVVAWEATGSGETGAGASASFVAARIFNANGTPAGNDFQVNSTADGVQGQASIAALPDGRFFIAWLSMDAGESGAGATQGLIRGRLFNTDGSPDGNDIQINTSVVGQQNRPTAIALSDNRIVVSWQSADTSESGAGASGTVIRSQILDPRGANFDGTFGDDQIYASDGDNIVNGLPGNDVIFGLLANDTIFGGAGSDTLDGGDGNDTLVGNDDIFASVVDTLIGGNDNDTLHGEFSDIINGGAGTDFLFQVNSNPWNIDLGATSIEWMSAGFGSDTINAATQTASVEVFASGGNDTVTGSAFNDFLWLGAGNDTAVGGNGDDMLFGDIGADSLSGGDGNDNFFVDSADTLISGGNGVDNMYWTEAVASANINMATSSLEWAQTQGGNDTITGATGSANLTVYAGGGTDIITGGSGADFLWGEAGNDTITGNDGSDTLVGGTGIDTLTGGIGVDTLYANSGNGADSALDTFVFTAGWGTDFVYDFENGTDKFDMTALSTNFGALTVTTVGPHAQVSLGGNLFIVVNGAGQIDQTDFLF